MRKETFAKIDRDGLWILCGQFLNSDGKWKTADNVGGFIGDEFKNSGHDVDLKLAALTAAGLEYTIRNLPETF